MRSAEFPLPLLLLLAMITGLDALAIDLHLPAFGLMAADLQAPQVRIALTLTAFVGGMGVGQLLWAPVLDAFGRRVPTLAGIAIFVAASALCAVASDFSLLLVGRLVMGLAAGVAVTVPRIVIADLCDERAQARAYSTLMQVFLIVPVISPLIGAALLGLIGWRGLFWLLALAGLVMLVWSVLAMPDSLPRGERRPLQAGIFLRGFGRLLSSPLICGLLTINALVSGVLFAYLGNLAAAVSQDFGFGPMEISVLFAVNALGLIAAGSLNKWLLRRHDPAKILPMALASMIVGGAGMALVMSLLPRALHLGSLAPLFLAISMLSLAFPNLTALTMAAAGPERGNGSALYGIAQNLGGAAVGMAMLIFGTGMAGLGLSLSVAATVALALWLVLGRETRDPVHPRGV